MNEAAGLYRHGRKAAAETAYRHTRTDHRQVHLYAETGAGDVTALRGSTGARLRVGDWRVLFDQTAGEISVRTVGHRRDSYRA